MALLAKKEDTRPRNSDHRRRIEEMYAPERLIAEMVDDYSNLDSEHSVDDHLDNTDDFRRWVRQKRIGTNLDPENRIPMQISDSPLSDYNIEFTRLNRTADSITPASLSSLNIPQASRASLSVSLSTPVVTPRKSRPSSATSRRSGNYTPKLILREKQQASVDRRLTKGRLTRDFAKNFLPTTSSTPVQSTKNRQSSMSRQKTVDKRETESIVSSSNGDAHESDVNTLISINNRSDRTLTDENKAAEPVSTSQIHESHHHDTVIPETQDVSETEDTVIPETQDIPESQDFVPETQEDEMPATQDDVANNPVQAQVTQQNTEQQAEPRNNISERHTQRIRSRPPIRGQSQISTPSKQVPPTTQIAKPISKTPSRLPIPIQITGTPRPIQTTALTPISPIVVEDTPRPNVIKVTSSNAQNAGRMNKHRTPASQSIQPSPAPQTVIPASNITVNVNVSNSQPQSPRQTTQTIRTHDKNIEKAINGGGGGGNDSGGDQRNSTNESLMTNDSDSHGNEANLSSDSRCDTPRGDKNNKSACRRLFSKDEKEETRRSATFNKVDNMTRTIDNMTPAIPGESPSVQFRTRSKNNNTNTMAKSPSVIAPNSQTFVKPKASLQNATYDVPAESASIQPSANSHRSHVGIDTEEFIALTSMERTNGSTFNNMADLPSEVQLDPIDVSDGEVDADEAIAVDKSQHHVQPSRNSKRLNEKKKKQQTQDIDYNSARWNPSVIMHRIPKKVATPQQSNENISTVRASRSYNILPPDEFQNSSIVEEKSPATQKITEKRISLIRKSLHGQQNESGAQKPRKSKRITREPDENLVIVNKHLEEISKKPPSGKSKPRRLRSIDDIHVNDVDVDDNHGEHIEASNQSQNQSTATTNESVFKKPNAKAPRRSRTSKANESNLANESAANKDRSQDQDDDNVNIDNHAEDNEPTSSNQTVQRDASPPQEATVAAASSSSSQKQKKKAQPKVHASATKKLSRSKSKTKETVATAQEDGASNDVTSSKGASRRSGRERKPYFKNIVLIAIGCKSNGEIPVEPPKAEKRKSRASQVVHRTEPVIGNRNDPESEPPRKKPRAQSEIGHPITRPSASKSVKSVNIGSRTSKFNKTMRKRTEHGVNSIASFTQDFGEYIKNKTQQKLQWWKELNDTDEVGPIIHGDEADIEFFNSDKYGQMEVTSTDKIGYHEIEAVHYGFTPTQMDKSFGIMRFKPKSAKGFIRNIAELEMNILQGVFLVQSKDEEFEAFAGTDLTIPKDAEYGLVNCSDDIGIIQFTYATQKETTTENVGKKS